jgi:hypothetical protein
MRSAATPIATSPVVTIWTLTFVRFRGVKKIPLVRELKTTAATAMTPRRTIVRQALLSEALEYLRLAEEKPCRAEPGSSTVLMGD